MKTVTKIITKTGFFLVDLESIAAIDYQTDTKNAAIHIFSANSPNILNIKCEENEILDLFIQWNKMKEKKGMVMEMFHS